MLEQRQQQRDDRSTIRLATGLGTTKQTSVVPLTILTQMRKKNNGLNKSGTVRYQQQSKTDASFEVGRRSSLTFNAELMKHRVPATTVIPETVVVRKKKLPRFVFSQFHTARWIWDFVVIAALFWVTIFTPLQIAFSNEDGCGAGTCTLTKLFVHAGFITLEVVIDIIFWSDIGISFRTTYRENGEEVFDAKLITRRYLKGYFTIDLLSCIPGYPLAAIDLLPNPCFHDIGVSNNFGGFLQLIKFSKTSKLIKIARVVRIFRLAKVFKLLKKIEDRFVMVRLAAIKAMSILGGTFIMAHLFGCMFIFFAALDNDDYYSNSWISNNGLLESGYTCVDTYVTALYWSFTTMTTVGYGDVSPVSNVEKSFAMVAMMVGCITYSFIIVSISNLMRPNLNDEVMQNRMGEIKAYMDVRHVPAQLRLEIQEYFRHYYSKRTALEEASILDMLTPQLKDKMRNFLVKDTLDTIGFFKTLDNNAITLLLAVLKPFKLAAGKILFAAGESGTEMFFLIDGQMDIYTTDGIHIKTMHAVTSFGEVTMMGLEPERTATIVARTDCELLCLDQKDMIVAFRHYPEVMDHIIEGARQKYNKLKKIDEKAFTPKARDNISSGSPKERRISVAFNSPNGTGSVSPSTKKKERRISVAFNSPNGTAPVSPSKKQFDETKELHLQDDHNRVSELLKQLEVRLDRKLQVYSQELRSSIEDIKNPLLKQLEVRLGRKLHVYSQELRSAIEDIKNPGKDIKKTGRSLSQRKSRRVRAVNKSDQTVDQKQKKAVSKSDQTVDQKQKKAVNKSDQTVDQKQKKTVNKSFQTVNQKQKKAANKSDQTVNQKQKKTAKKSDQTVNQKQKKAVNKSDQTHKKE